MSSPQMDGSPALTFAHDGAQRVRSALGSAALASVRTALAGLPPGRAGIRLRGIAELGSILASSGPVGAVAASALGRGCRPVRAILFDKTPSTNWSLPWHQDRTIAVERRIDVDGFGPWSRKDGLPHVEPPFRLLSGMVTVRVHLDPLPADNAPLLIARGSHRLGRVPQAEVPRAVGRCSRAACLADAGDAWLYATPILHASDAASRPLHRRVLHVNFATVDLPGGLRWLGV